MKNSCLKKIGCNLIILILLLILHIPVLAIEGKEVTEDGQAPQTEDADITSVPNVSTIQINNNIYRVPEDGGEAVVTLVRDYPETTASVDCTLLAGTALPGENYTDVSQTVTFLPGESLASVRIPIQNSDEVTGNKSFTLKLENSVNAVIGERITATFTIVDKDYEAGTYKVIFDSQGGSPVKTIYNVASSSRVEAPDPAPERSGYVLENWYKDRNCTTPWNFSDEVITVDTTLYAKWVNDTQYDANGNPETGEPIQTAILIAVFIVGVIMFFVVRKKKSLEDDL